MIKLVAFLLILLAAAFGFSTLADTPGHFLLQWGETEYRVSLVTGTIALVVLVLAIMLAWSLIRLVFRLPGILGFASRMRRQAKGQQAIARGLIAVGSGDPRLAQRYAQDSTRLLGKSPLPLLLTAQAAQLRGDAKSAESAFRIMLEQPETRSLGLRGLYVEAERRGDAAAARQLAQEALHLSPDAAWANEAMLGFKAAEQDWRGAIALIDQGLSRRQIDKKEGRAQRAVLLAAAAREVSDSSPDEAFALAQEALRAQPALVPAAVLVAQRYSAKGDFSRASKVIEAAWKEKPHPDLAESYMTVRHGDSALDRLKRARYLLKMTPGAREARFAIARAALDAREFGAAREALEALVLEKPTVRACLLMAELEETESGNEGLVRAWLARASRAPREPEWVADGVVSADWSPVSPVTGRIGAFEWREPPQADEDHLRARIDAHRFEPAPEPVAIEPPPIEVEDTGIAPEPPVEIASATPAEAESPAPAEDAKAAPPPVNGTEDIFRPIIPDDPGPPAGPRKSGFRFFG